MTAAYPAAPPLGALQGSAATLERIAYFSLCGFLLVLPWEEAPQLGGYAIGRWLGLAALAIAILRVGMSWHSRKLSGLHYLMASFVGLSALSLLWTIDRDATLTRIGTYVQLLGLVWLMWEMAVTEKRVVGLLRAYASGVFLASVLTIYNYATGTTSVALYAAEGVEKSEETRFTIAGVNENDLGLMLAMCLPVMIYLAIRSNGKLLKLFFWIHAVTTITAILLSGSRGGMVSAAIALAILPLIIGRLPWSQKMAAALACIVGAVCGMVLVPQATWFRLFQLSSELTEGTLTHRTVIWSAGLAALRDHAFLGVGSGAYPAAVLRVVDVPYVAHNTFLSVLVELGVVGALLLLVLVSGLFYTAFRMKYLERCLWLTVLTSWAVGVTALTWEYSKPTWVMFGLLLAHAYSRRFTDRYFAQPAASPFYGPSAAFQKRELSSVPTS